MKKITAAEAQAGDIVAEPVLNEQGRTLLPEGSRLSAAVISRLEGWGVHELTIKSDDPDPAAEAGASDSADGDEGLLAALDHRFEAWADDATMMRIKSIARRHLASVRRS